QHQTRRYYKKGIFNQNRSLPCWWA
ncbi:macB-like periplasmic core domain protein, partial [Vibrio parahaemolyticus V-223/04]